MAEVAQRVVDDRAALTRLTGQPHRRPPASAGAVVPEDSRPKHPARIPRQVVPPVLVDVVLRLAVAAGGQGRPEVWRQRSGDEPDHVGGAERGLIEQELADRIDLRPPRHQIDHAAHCSRSVQRGRDALDHFDLSEIHWRDLQQAQAADLLSGQRQAVEQHPGVAAFHALDANAGRAERRRRRLHAHAAHFVQHHHDVAGRHQHLLFDLFAVEDLDAGRLIIDAAAGAGGGDDDLFLVLNQFGRRRRFLRSRHRRNRYLRRRLSE